jgi:NADH-quinone oxidoreductase subunit C
MSDSPRMEVPDVSAQEKLNQLAMGRVAGLDPRLDAVRGRLAGAFAGLAFEDHYGELTVVAHAAQLPDLLRFAKDDPELRCEMLTDVTGVHWPAGRQEHRAQETTGWPTYEVEQEGRIDVLYMLVSVTHGHRFRIRVSLPDDAPVVPSAVDTYRSANVLEREVFDLMGVRFEGHPRLERIFMPEDWEGHPLRKDYPLGGVEVQYKGATVPPPDERQY